MNVRRLIEFVLEGLAAIQAAVPGGHLLPPPMPGGHLLPPPEKTIPSNPERELSWTVTR